MKDLLWGAVAALFVIAAAVVALLWMTPRPSYAGFFSGGHSHRGSQLAGPSCGIASWYGYTRHPTANGERFDGSGMTAASPNLPFGIHVRVTLSATGRSVIVRINDRGPFVRGRIIDLSRAAAERLGITRQGTGHVCLSPED